ncbi:MAG: YhdH/YhfP family quinone oxidoreductase [Flavobacteriales bacterium]|nr:YhdH/YhfP family quinone oxidoreductase [Flavobacteriales bacterium]
MGDLPSTYRALVAREAEDGTFSHQIEELDFDFLPDHEVTIKVHYSALNYKDALSASGHKGITRNYPHTPGVDAVGEIVEDKSGKWAPGTAVLCTSFDLGMNTAGGFGQYIRVPAEWVVALPKGLSMPEAAAYGTAAYTAALALHKMEACGQIPEMGPIVVTGATGGVGSMAVALLKHAGYDVHAATGKADKHDYLRSLGASQILTREEVDDQSGRPLLRSRWSGAIDNVGGNTLATLIKGCARNGSVATIGLVASAELQTTVYPFILNGVNLLGVDSAETPIRLRHQLWEKLATEWRFPLNQSSVSIVRLDAIPSAIARILEGNTTGRTVCRMS